MEDLVKELEKIKLENEKLRRQQDQTHGGPVDTVDKMKKELERAKATNKFLLSDIETWLLLFLHIFTHQKSFELSKQLNR
jgi:hypothetical protein